MTEVAGSSNSNNLLLEQFKDICAVETEIARRFLTESNWNLEAAVHLYFHANDPEAIQNDDNARNEHEIRRRNVANPRNEAPANQNAVVRRSSESQLDTWSAWFRALLALPFRLAYFSLREIFLFIYALFGGNALAITNPREDLQKFLTAIANYPNSERINWFNGTYNEVLNEAKSSVRFLLVYLHNPSHQSTETFLDKVLFNKIFSDFVRDNNIIMWGTDVRTNEGYKVATSLHELTYPCLSLICLRENRMACVLRINGMHEITPVLTALQTALAENQRFLNAILHERAQRELDNRLRREQEQEYQIALEQDRAKTNERRRLESERQDAERREREEKENLLIKKQHLAEIRERLRAELTNELAVKDGETIRISVRFPSGAKFDKIFGADDSLEKLFNSVLVHTTCPDDFSLVTSYPRVHLQCAPDWYREFSSVEENFGEIKTFRQAGLENSLVVLVRDNDA